jgi:diguanylate cyclase (GGDEF)-like protein
LVGLAALVAVVLLVASRNGMVFGAHVGPVLLLPFVIFVAARFGTRWAALASLTAAMLTVALTTAGRSPFGDLPPRDMVIQAQEFILIMSLIALGLSALLSELRTKHGQLEASNRRLDELNQELEARVEERTARLRTLNAQLEQLALTDALTGLLNRRAFVDLARQEIAHSQRQHRPLALMMVDIDHFKSINDRYGHQAGDVVLRQVAAVIKRIIRAGDTLVRYGGEEFVLLAPDSDQEGALELSERIRQSLRSEPIVTEQGSVTVTASFGVTMLREDDTDPEQLLRRADHALYMAKANGRDRVIATGSDQAKSIAL